MGTKRAADIVAASLSGEEVMLLVDFGRKNVTSPEELSETFLSLQALRLIEVFAGGPEVIVTLFGREVLAQIGPDVYETKNWMSIRAAVRRLRGPIQS